MNKLAMGWRAGVWRAVGVVLAMGLGVGLARAESPAAPDAAPDAAPPAATTPAQPATHEAPSDGDPNAADANVKLERERLESKVTGWRARAYRKLGGAASTAVLRSLAGAARLAQKADQAENPAVRRAADLAADLAERWVGPRRDASGQPDWEAIALALDEAARSKSAAVRQSLSVSYLLMGLWDVALFEVEAIEPEGLKDDRARAGHLALRGLVRGLTGHERLGSADLRDAERLFTADGQVMDEQVRAGLQMALAVVHLQHNNFARADLMLGQVTRRYPNNPVAVFLSGERLAADGQYEKAARSLESVLAKTKHPWLAERIAERAKQFRDNPKQAKPLLLDDVFLGDLLKAYLAETAQESQAIAEFKAWTQSLGELGGRLREQLPAWRKPDLRKWFKGTDDEPAEPQPTPEPAPAPEAP